MNVATNLECSALFFPNNHAIRAGGREISYAQLNEEASRIASGLLRSGLHEGDFVGLCAPNSPDWLAFYFGVLKAGGVAVTLSSLLSRGELELLVGHSLPRFVFTSEARIDELAALQSRGKVEKLVCPGGDITLEQLRDRGTASFLAVERSRCDTAAILYTGGTTGIPKGVMLTHENINLSAHNVAFSERSTPTDTALCFLPFNHVFAQMHIMNATIMSAGCLDLLPAFDPDRVVQLMEAGRVTKMFAVPTVYTRLLGLDRLGEITKKVRYCFSAAASLPTEVVRQWKDRTGIVICEGYGLTESASAVTYNHYYRHVVGSIGGVVPGVEVQIRDISGNRLKQGEQGEICILGHNIMKGYLENPEATAEAFWQDGWFRSGDIGYIDGEGYVYIVDRLKDLIITGGENVYPREVEEALYTKPEVEECAVLGMPDNVWGERIVAFVVPKGQSQITAEELKAFCKARLAPYKVPKEFVIIRELAKNAAGKILKRELKQQYDSLKNGSS